MCIDIKLSLLNKNYNISNSSFPVVMTFKDDLIKNNNLDKENNIHFICVIDYILNGNKNEHAKDIMHSIIDNSLKNNDKMTFITFKEHNQNDYNNANLFNFMKPNIDRKTELNFSITFLIWDKINKSIINQSIYKNNAKENRNTAVINSIFYFTENHSQNYIEILKDINKKLNNLDSPFSLYLVSDEPNYPKSFSIFSDSGNISFIPFNEDGSRNTTYYNEFVNKATKDLRNIKYKDNQIIITSKYNITKFYGKNYLNIISKREENGNYIYSFPKYQIISGKEYSYFFEVDLNENIKYGDRILYAKINYKYLNGTPNETYSSSLKFYNAINYFNVKKKEFCRILLMEIIEFFLINKNKYKYNELAQEIEPINLFCKNNFTENINSKEFNRSKNNVLVYLNKFLWGLLQNN